MITREKEIEYKKIEKRYAHSLTDLITEKVQTDIPLLSSYISILRNKKLFNKIECLKLTVSEIRKLGTLLNTYEKYQLRNVYIYLYLKSPTEITLEEYKKLCKEYNIFSVVVSGLVKTIIEHGTFARILDAKLWYIYLEKLEQLTKDIRYFFDQDDYIDREKKMVSILCKRIVETLTYDLDAEEKYNYRNLYKYHSQFASNEMVGIIDGYCACGGYAGILRDGCALLGIDAMIVYGDNGNVGHVWNQVKLDGEWYNLDLTWDADNILNNRRTYWFLKSDNDFEKYGGIIEGREIRHRDYKMHRLYENVCNRSVSEDKVEYYLNLEETKKRIC